MYSIHQLELIIIKAIQGFQAPWIITFFKTVNVFDYDYTYMAIIIIVWNMIDAQKAFDLLYLQVMGGIAFSFLKVICALPRPYDLDPTVALLKTTGYGFPSGAATSAMICFGFLFLSYRKRFYFLKIVAPCMIFLVGLTRVYLGAHFITDVLAGYLLGIIILWIYQKVKEPVIVCLHNYSLFKQWLLHLLFFVFLAVLFGQLYLLGLVCLLMGILTMRLLVFKDIAISFNVVNPLTVFKRIGTLGISLLTMAVCIVLLKQFDITAPFFIVTFSGIFFVCGILVDCIARISEK